MPTFVRHTVQAPFIVLLDLVAIFSGLCVSVWIRWGHLVAPAENLHACLRAAPLMALAAITLFYVVDLYGHWWRRTRSEISYSIGSAVALLALAVMARSYWLGEFTLPRSVLIIATIFQLVCSTMLRLTLRRLYLRI